MRNRPSLQLRQTIRRERVRLERDPYFTPLVNPRLVQYFTDTYGINRYTVARMLRGEIYTNDTLYTNNEYVPDNNELMNDDTPMTD